jgi:hypothetical protein
VLSDDGKYVLVIRDGALGYLTWPERELRPLSERDWVVSSAQLSPDGRFVAYSSNDSGRREVYVSPFPAMTSKWQVSSRGGEEPRCAGTVASCSICPLVESSWW